MTRNLMAWACAIGWHDWRVVRDPRQSRMHFVETCSWCHRSREISTPSSFFAREGAIARRVWLVFDMSAVEGEKVAQVCASEESAASWISSQPHASSYLAESWAVHDG